MKNSTLNSILILSLAVLIVLGAGFYFSQGWLSNGSLTNQLAGLLKMTGSDDSDSVSLASLIWEVGGFSEEKNYLILFQNNLELRPSGGYLGNIGFLKVKNGQVKYLASHDTNIYDGYGQVQTEPPAPLKQYLQIENWQTRDANWSPDFPTAALKTEELYQLVGGLDGGKEEFDGIIAINASLLPELLALTGPIYLAEFDKTFTQDDVLYELEYELEKGYVQRGIIEGERKTMFKQLLDGVVENLTSKNIWELNDLRELMIKELDEKNVTFYFHDQQMQANMVSLGWAGTVDQSFADDYLMIVEANLGGRKSNYFVDRSLDYSVNLDKEKPEAVLKITYKHNGTQNDWFNHDYLCYLRIYTPAGSWLTNVSGLENKTEFSNDLGKNVFGHWLEVATNSEKTIEFTYLLPESLKQGNEYNLLIQKQSGVDEMPVSIKVIKDGKVYAKEKVITSDWQGAIHFEL